MRIHVIAVAGTGMGSLAGLLREVGHDVTGSDVHFYPPMGPALREWGISLREGFAPAHLDDAPDLVVVGNVCRRDNPLVVAAEERGLERVHIAGALQRFVLPGTSPLVVTGTHGKTTTSALAAWLLDRSGFAPGFLVGGVPKAFPRSFRAPTLPTKGALPRADRPRRPPFVIEGDEYDTAFWEKTAKFLHYDADVAIVTSIEHDHIDIYPTVDSYEDAFRKFLRQLPPTGLCIAHGADDRVRALVKAESRAPIAWYGLGDEVSREVPTHWLAEPVTLGPEGSTFDLFAGGVLAGRFHTPLPGRHNLRNTVAAIAAAAQGYGAPLDQLRRELPAYEGVRRRQELIGTPGGVALIDDFAHHPTAVRETLLALRALHPTGRLFAVFEPRSATACRKLHQEAYVDAFLPANEVLLAPLGRSTIAADEALDLERLALEIGAAGVPALAATHLDQIVAHLVAHARPGDCIALLSNGAFGGIHSTLRSALEGREQP